MGVAVATYVLSRPSLPLPEPTGLLAWQVRGMLAVGVTLFLLESVVFAATVGATARLGERATESVRA
jgi:hypothetical protein